MDLSLNALIGMTYMVPIAITLRKIYAPSFDIPEPIAAALRRLDQQRPTPIPTRVIRPPVSRGFELRP